MPRRGAAYAEVENKYFYSIQSLKLSVQKILLRKAVFIYDEITFLTNSPSTHLKNFLIFLKN